MKCRRCNENKATICTRCTGDIQDAGSAKDAAHIEALEAALEPLLHFVNYPESCGATIEFNHNIDHFGPAKVGKMRRTARAALREPGAGAGRRQ